MAHFRRPASLSIQQQEAIEGGIDPALKDQAAHDSAAALLTQTRASVDPSVIERVLSLVESEGLEDLAALWAGATPSSLPGALWRLYVLHTWVLRDTAEVQHRFSLGRATVPGLNYLAGIPDPPDLDSMRATLDEILRGAFTGDLSIALARAAAITMLVAYGTAHAADATLGVDSTSFSDAFGAAHGEPGVPEALTKQAKRLLDMGEALEAAARDAAAGKLL